MSGFFPVMMFGLPAACLAMYHTSAPERRRATGGLMLAGNVCPGMPRSHSWSMTSAASNSGSLAPWVASAGKGCTSE